ALGLLVPFAAYLLAEELHASGVLSVVAAGFVLGSKNSTAGFATRLQAREVWKSLDTLLEAFVFAYMGLQCRFVFTDLRFDWLFALQALTVLLVVLLIRPAWVFLTYGRKWTLAKLGLRTRGLLPWKYQVVISWTGMRGVVTLAPNSRLYALSSTCSRLNGVPSTSIDMRMSIRSSGGSFGDEVAPEVDVGRVVFEGQEVLRGGGQVHA
ncbi:cation:proton antiporter, partial [Kibdelosporangium lantanae]